MEGKKNLSDLFSIYNSKVMSSKIHQEEVDSKIDKERELIDKYDRLIVNHKKKIEKLIATRYNKTPHWIEEILNPLGDQLAKKTGLNYEIVGPFGMRAQTSIYFFPEGANWCGGSKYCLSVIPILNEAIPLLYETGKTIDGMVHTHSSDPNGYNNETKPLPDNIEAIYELMIELNKDRNR